MNCSQRMEENLPHFSVECNQNQSKVETFFYESSKVCIISFSSVKMKFKNTAYNNSLCKVGLNLYSPRNCMSSTPNECRRQKQIKSTRSDPIETRNYVSANCHK